MAAVYRELHTEGEKHSDRDDHTDKIAAYVIFSGPPVVPAGGHAVNCDHWFPEKELREQGSTHLHWETKWRE